MSQSESYQLLLREWQFRALEPESTSFEDARRSVSAQLDQKRPLLHRLSFEAEPAGFALILHRSGGRDD
jgi:hypothetical protein